MITKADISDIPALNHLINSAYRGESSKKGWTTEAHLLEGTRTDEKELTEIIQREGNTIFKLSQDNQIVACVLLIAKENKLYLGMLTVSPELQNSAFGKQLLNHAEVYARELGLPSIVMTVISIRPELIAWYKRHGYVDTGEREAFPAGFSDVILVDGELEFVVLEKELENRK